MRRILKPFSWKLQWAKKIISKIKENPMPKNYDKLLRYSLGILLRKRHTCNSMLDKLEQYSKKWKLYDSEDEKEEMLKMVLDRLITLKYLDDLQFLKDYILDRVKFKPRGKFLLSRELLLKGLDKNFIAENIEKLDIDETEMAIRALSKRSKTFKKLANFEMRNKSFTFLSSRGFNPDAIYKAIDYHYSNSVNEDL